MDSNWVNSLDMLAAGGVIDFDAPAYLLDQSPRYVGNPKVESLPLENPSLLPDGVKLKDVPSIDEYNGKGNVVDNPTWKKVLFGALVIGGVALGLGMLMKHGKIKMPAFFSKMKKPAFLSKIKMPDMSKFGTTMKNFGKKILNFIKKPFVWIKTKFKK